MWLLGSFAVLSQLYRAELTATGAPVSAGPLAAAAGLSASYPRALVAEFQARSPVTQGNGIPAAATTLLDPPRGS